MSTSADLVRIAVVEELIYGVTPSNPAFKVVRTTGEGLAFAPTTTQSSEMNPARQITDSILTGGQSSGDLNFELAYEEWFEALLTSAFCNVWVSNGMNIGTTLKSFTIEKTIPVPGGTTQYHRFTGCVMDGFSLNIRPNQPITGSFTVQGKAVTTSTALLAGATYDAADLLPVMTAPRVVDIQIGGIPAISKCFNNLQLTLANNNRAIECIGTLGPRELALGRAEVTAQFSVLFNDSDLLQTLINQDETSLQFRTTDTFGVGSPAAENFYRWILPRIKFTANPVVAGGTNQDVVNAINAQGLLSAIAPLTSLRVERTPRV